MSSSLEAVNAQRKKYLDRQDRDALGFKESTSPSWVFEHHAFQGWLASEQSSTLWIYGTAGIGKSVLTAYLSQELKVRQPSSTVSYFFCTEDNTLLQDASQLIRTFLYQVTRDKNDSRELIQNICDTNSSIADGSAALSDFVDVLLIPVLGSLCSTGTIILLVDGLNECSDDKLPTLLHLFEKLDQVIRSNEPRVPIIKLLITSRETPQISRAFENVPKATIYGENADNIDAYVRQTLSADSRVAQTFEAVKVDAIQYFREHSHGMFLWVYLMLECFRWATDEQLKSLMAEEAPKEIDDLYRKVFNGMATKLRKIEVVPIVEILQWVTIASRDLTMMELRLGIALCRDPDITIDNIPKPADLEIALKRCGCFVQVVSETDSTDKERISLAHQSTFRRFITDQNSVPASFLIDLDRTNALIATTLLSYLARERKVHFPDRLLGRADIEEMLGRSHPFFLCAVNWRTHLRSACHLDSQTMQALKDVLIKFLQHDSLVNWIKYMLVYTHAWGKLWTTYNEVLGGVGDLVDWLKAHKLILRVAAGAGQNPINLVPQMPGSDEAQIENNESTLSSIISRAAADVWLLDNPSYSASSNMAFNIVVALDNKAKKRDTSQEPDIQSLTKLATKTKAPNTSWWDANLGHGYLNLSSRASTTMEAVCHALSAKGKYIESLENSGYEDPAGMLVWCRLCDSAIRISELSGKALDTDELQKFKDRVAPLSDRSNDSKMDFEMAEVLYRIARICFDRFQATDDEDSLDTAITLSDALFYSVDPDYIDVPSYGNFLSFACFRRYSKKGQIKDLQYAIEIARWGLENGSFIQRADSKFSLGFMLATLYECTHMVEDAKESILWAEAALKDCPLNDAFVNSFAIVLNSEYGRSGLVENLDKGIQELQKLLERTNLGPQSIGLYKRNLAEALLRRMEETGDFEGLRQAASLAQDGVQQLSTQQASIHLSSGGLVLSFAFRIIYERTRDYGYLTRAYDVLQAAVSLEPMESPSWRSYMLELAKVAELKYDHTGCIHCLQDTVDLSTKAFQASEERDCEEERAEYARMLSTAYRKKFEKDKETDDLEKALNYSELAVRWNDRQWKKPEYHILRGLVLLTKFSTRPENESIEAAIESFRLAVDTVGERGAPARSWAYHNLGVALRIKYEFRGLHEDLDASLKWAAKAVEQMPEPHITNAVVATNFAKASLLHSKSESGIARDLYTSARLVASSLVATPVGHVTCGELVAVLADALEAAGEWGQETLQGVDEAAVESKSICQWI